MPLKLAMLGTGTFALPTFHALLDSEHDVDLLVTQPDRTGRGHHRHVNPLKELAASHGVPVFQPANIKTAESLKELRSHEIDLYVTAAYGQILSAELLAIPRLGAINLHGSLLPKYRGAAPVQYAVLNGDTETGVTVFQIEPKLDAGPMLGVVKTPIDDRETAGELHDRLAELAAPLAVDVVTAIGEERADAITQESDDVTRAPKLKKEDGVIDWSRSARLVSAQIRAVQPWPKPLTRWRRSTGDVMPLIVTAIEPTTRECTQHAAPGTVTDITSDEVILACGDSTARLLFVKPPGKREMTGLEFARGYQLTVGDQFVSDM